MDVKLIECPRDAMQGIKDYIPVELKANYINRILKCNFDTVDFGSFVSPKAMPQMKDTTELISLLDLSDTKSKLLSIIANKRGAENAVQFDEIYYLGYPFSISEEFQKRNTNSTIEESIKRVDAIQNIALKNNKELVVYLSMGFGNPYGEFWDTDLVIKWSERLHRDFDIKILALSDTIGCATIESVNYLFNLLVPELPNVEFGAHLHTRRENAKKMIEAAFNAGCNRFDGAIKGYGGCPMAEDKLTGNMPTEMMLHWFEQNKVNTTIEMNAFNDAMEYSNTIFSNHV